MAKVKTKSEKENDVKTTVTEPVVEDNVNTNNLSETVVSESEENVEQTIEDDVNNETVVKDTTNDISETVIPEVKDDVIDIEKEQEAGEKELLKMFKKDEFVFEEKDIYTNGTKRYFAQKPPVSKTEIPGAYVAQKPF